MRKLRESLSKMTCCFVCLACFALSAAAEQQLTLKPVKMPHGGNAFVCKNIAYGTRQPGKGAAHPDVAQTYDLYLPAEIGKIPEGAPLFLYVHGGAWIAGNKNWPMPLFAEMAKNGFVVASIGGDRPRGTIENTGYERIEISI